MKYNPDIHHRQSIRLKGYDYAKPGFYFITICIHNRKRPLFGEVRHGVVILTPFGEIVQSQWHTIPKRFPNVTIDEYITMPNHIHGIIHIHPNADTRDHADPVRAPLAGAPAPSTSSTGAHGDNHNTGGVYGLGPGATARVAPPVTTVSSAPMKTVGDIVGAFKSLCVHECLQWIKLNDPERILGTLWQRNYWEHIIRNESELDRIRTYIRNNPANWERDRFLRDAGLAGEEIRESITVYNEEDWMI